MRLCWDFFTLSYSFPCCCALSQRWICNKKLPECMSCLNNTHAGWKRYQNTILACLSQKALNVTVLLFRVLQHCRWRLLGTASPLQWCRRSVARLALWSVASFVQMRPMPNISPHRCSLGYVLLLLLLQLSVLVQHVIFCDQTGSYEHVNRKFFRDSGASSVKAQTIISWISINISHT